MPSDRIIIRNGKKYLVRNGEVFVKLRKWWASGPVSAWDRSVILDLARQYDEGDEVARRLEAHAQSL